MNKISISARVISILKTEKDGKPIANCFLQERNGEELLTYQVSFWGDAAECILENVEKYDEIELTGYAYNIKENSVGPYLEIRNCKLINIIQRRKIAVEDVKSLQQKEVEKNGNMF